MSESNSVAGRHILLGLSGGIACYKIAELTRLLVKAGATVQVVMTEAAEAFITPVTMQALSNRPVFTSQWDARPENNMAHINLTREADVMLIAPASADMIAKLAHSSGDGYNYRHTIAPWARSLFTLSPDIERMEGVPVSYQVHAVIGMALIALVPYTRLVHMFSAPVQYLFRPYIVYRSRDPKQLGPRPERRGWEETMRR